jgi:hypothetical protein
MALSAPSILLYSTANSILPPTALLRRHTKVPEFGSENNSASTLRKYRKVSAAIALLPPDTKVPEFGSENNSAGT